MKVIFQLIAGDRDCCFQRVPTDTSSEVNEHSTLLAGRPRSVEASEASGNHKKH